MEKQLIGVEEVSQRTGMSKTYVYKLIRRLNDELDAQGLVTIPGKISLDYFESRLFSASLLALL